MRLVTGLLKPARQIPGSAFAGIVEACGDEVFRFKPGDRVFGFDDEGAMSQAEYTSVSGKYIEELPASISFEQAAASSEGAHYALNFINKVKIQAGQQILVNGATGAIGSAMVQILKSMHIDVTAVCAEKNRALVESLGADRVIDYLSEDFTRSGLNFHFVFDTVGKSSYFKCRKLLLPGGAYISSDLGYLWQNIFLPPVTALLKPLIGNRISVFPTPKDIQASLRKVRQLIEQGEFQAVIDRSYALERIIEAYEYVDSGKKIGNVVVTLD